MSVLTKTASMWQVSHPMAQHIKSVRDREENTRIGADVHDYLAELIRQGDEARQLT